MKHVRPLSRKEMILDAPADLRAAAEVYPLDLETATAPASPLLKGHDACQTLRDSGQVRRAEVGVLVQDLRQGFVPPEQDHALLLPLLPLELPGRSDHLFAVVLAQVLQGAPDVGAGFGQVPPEGYVA